ncbi:cation-translocating P-type ATPase [Aquibium sp. A9E412]|uniref:cation-translocating P-type ATPase n=1 Tax=Aquibium sp. A9E412 TaxID=2976767 RepID=UPI0025B08318|nr:cation-translocating P-type ATPase [Aquibium sp. A9E412]MDN2567584.1 cation-translocating P-type ATPase [Aquibium sp. A9E412]
MSCCAPGTEAALDRAAALTAGPSPEEVRLASRDLGDGLRQTDLSVPGIHCGACIQAIESALARLDGVVHARVNLSSRRVSVRWRGDAPPPIVPAINALGYEAHLDDGAGEARDETLAELIRAVAVSGFAAGNIMLLSVSVWSGAQDATRDLFHWISALIAVPALVFAGRIFYRSAFQALRHGRMNMDVPIALGVSLAYGLSLYETINHGQHAYFDAAVSLLFFLLIGRTLDHVMRERTRVAVSGLARLAPRGALVLGDDGTRSYLPLGEIEPGMRLMIAAGERIPVDGRVVAGSSELDCALVTGESAPQPIARDGAVRAGTLNLTGPLTVEAEAAAKDSFLAEMLRLMEAAEGGRARYRRIADRASALYSPVVHLTALLTFAGWMVASGGDWHQSLTIAIAVLIITCPCALGLAVPIVQVVAARRLFESGIMVKDGSAMERLAEIDTVVFDKTGTLTLGAPRPVGLDAVKPRVRALTAAIAAHSRHPLSQALAAAAPAGVPAPAFSSVREVPGYGVEAEQDGIVYRLGRAEWAAPDDPAARDGTVLARDGMALARFDFEDRLRRDARTAVETLQAEGLAIELISGDREEAVRSAGAALAIDAATARALPGDKASRLDSLARQGHRALMVGDGLNDAPALAAAHVSMAPATAADIGRNAADFVFLRESLYAVPQALDIARRAGRLVRQNFALAIGYNVIAVPIAVLGHVTPLIAAVAMSLSSLIVVANAMRLRPARAPQRAAAADSRAEGVAPGRLATAP